MPLPTAGQQACTTHMPGWTVTQLQVQWLTAAAPWLPPDLRCRRPAWSWTAARRLRHERWRLGSTESGAKQDEVHAADSGLWHAALAQGETPALGVGPLRCAAAPGLHKAQTHPRQLRQPQQPGQ